MHLSRVELDMGKMHTIRAFGTPNMFHGALEACIGKGPGEKSGCLWRVDSLRGGKQLIVLSDGEPDLSPVAHQFGWDGAWESKPYDGLLSRLDKGSSWRFRLVANPTVCKKQVDGGKGGEGGEPPKQKRGKRAALAGVEAQRDWLAKRCGANGFSLDGGSFDVVGDRWHIFYKRGRDGKPSHVKIRAVEYEGSLVVTDPEKFRSALTGGIGRGRAYGMGLMTICR